LKYNPNKSNESHSLVKLPKALRLLYFCLGVDTRTEAGVADNRAADRVDSHADGAHAAADNRASYVRTADTHSMADNPDADALDYEC